MGITPSREGMVLQSGRCCLSRDRKNLLFWCVQSTDSPILSLIGDSRFILHQKKRPSCATWIDLEGIMLGKITRQRRTNTVRFHLPVQPKKRYRKKRRTAQPGALWWLRRAELGWWEEDSRGTGFIDSYDWFMLFYVWQEPTQHWKATLLQLKNKEKSRMDWKVGKWDDDQRVHFQL